MTLPLAIGIYCLVSIAVAVASLIRGDLFVAVVLIAQANLLGLIADHIRRTRTEDTP